MAYPALTRRANDTNRPRARRVCACARRARTRVIPTVFSYPRAAWSFRAACFFVRVDKRPTSADTHPMPNSRNKGATGEREAAAAWTAATGLPAARTAQRTGKHGDADVETPAPVHLEIKRRARIAAVQFLRQAEQDATPGRVPVVVAREDGDTEWVVMFRLNDARAFANALRTTEGNT
jgi:hypothetical protein